MTIAEPRPSHGTEQGERLVEVVLANGRCLRVCPAIDEASLARLIRVVEGA